MKKNQRHNFGVRKKALAEGQNDLNAVTYTNLVQGYRQIVNNCRLNQQDAFWAILLSEKEEAIQFLGEEEAKRTMLGMVEEAFRTHVKI